MSVRAGRLPPVAAAADVLRRWGQRQLGKQLDGARFAHWTAQWYPAWVVADRQWSRLRAMVSYARSASPFYRTRLSALPDDFDAETFARVPALTRRELAEHAALIRCRSGPLARASGGSRGLPVRVPVDREAYAWYVAGTWLGLRWWGTDFTERAAVLLGPGPRGLARLLVAAKDWVLNWLRLPVDRRFDDGCRHVLRRLHAFRPAYLYTYPSAAHRLANEVLDRGADPPRGLKVVVLTGEPPYAFQRRQIQAAFGCPVTVEYGSSEVGCMAFECPHGTLHVMSENVYLEQGPEPGLGNAAALVVTQLHNRVFPLLRYRLGDLGVVRPPTCPCGRGFPEVQVVGRTDEVLTGGGEVLPARGVLDRVFDLLPDPLQGRVRLRHPAPGRVVVEIHEGVDAELRRARDVVADVLGSGWSVEAAAGRFERLPSGKLPYFLRG